MLRRLEFTIFQIMLVGHPWVQVWANILFSLIFLAFIIFCRPFKDNSAFIATLIGEICVNIVFIASSFFLVCDDQNIVKNIESICIYVIFGTVSLQIGISMIDMVKELRMTWKKFEKLRAMQFAKNATNANLRLELGF